MSKFEVVYTVNEKQNTEKVEATSFDYFHDCGRLGVVFYATNIGRSAIFFDVVKVSLVK